MLAMQHGASWEAKKGLPAEQGRHALVPTRMRSNAKTISDLHNLRAGPASAKLPWCRMLASTCSGARQHSRLRPFLRNYNRSPTDEHNGDHRLRFNLFR